MSKQAFEEANELFVDDKYEEAYELYTKALNSDDKTDSQFTSKVLVARAQCSLKLKKYAGKKNIFLTFLNLNVFVLDALNDSNNAIQLDETNIKAYLRKGTALFNQDSKEEALKTFIRGLEIDCKFIQYYLFI
jgi:tetratricopeptide (TPR) repeat protein